ncbi:hypothetical protein ACFL5V_11500 [Fibrobacterota bacterium]
MGWGKVKSDLKWVAGHEALDCNSTWMKAYVRHIIANEFPSINKDLLDEAVEKHMWEDKDFMSNSEFVNRLRKELEEQGPYAVH